MPPLKTGRCDSCDKDDVKLRENPFDKTEQCEDCRKDAIIGITDVKTQYKLKEDQLEGLQTVSTPKPAFLGGADQRWYLVDEIKARAEKEGVEAEKGSAKKGSAKKETASAKKDSAKKGSAKKDTASAKKEKSDAAKTPSKTPTKSPKETKRKMSSVAQDEAGEDKQEIIEEEAAPPAKRGRGRPPKAAGTTKAAKAAKAPKVKKAPAVDEDGKPKGGRGRPPKAK